MDDIEWFQKVGLGKDRRAELLWFIETTKQGLNGPDKRVNEINRVALANYERELAELDKKSG